MILKDLKRAIMNQILDIEELERKLGAHLRALRLQKNLDQISLAKQAGLSVTALKHLESGGGASLKTLIKVLRVLGRESWFDLLAPTISVNPLHMMKQKKERQRASRRDRGKKEKAL